MNGGRKSTILTLVVSDPGTYLYLLSKMVPASGLPLLGTSKSCSWLGSNPKRKAENNLDVWQRNLRTANPCRKPLENWFPCSLWSVSHGRHNNYEHERAFVTTSTKKVLSCSRKHLTERMLQESQVLVVSRKKICELVFLRNVKPCLIDRKPASRVCDALCRHLWHGHHSHLPTSWNS